MGSGSAVVYSCWEYNIFHRSGCFHVPYSIYVHKKVLPMAVTCSNQFFFCIWHIQNVMNLIMPLQPVLKMATESHSVRHPLCEVSFPGSLRFRSIDCG